MAEPARDDGDFVRIRHPEVGVSPNPVTRRAAQLVWAPLNWEIVSDDVAEKADAAVAKKAAKAAATEGA